MPDDADPMFDEAAERVRRELIEVAVDQISKPIAHEFDIRIEIEQSGGANTILVEARSRSVQPAVTQVRVDVLPAPGDDSDLVVVRDAGSHRLAFDVADAYPDVSDALQHRLSDFVAGCIAAALARLNAEMQRRLGQHGGWAGQEDAD